MLQNADVFLADSVIIDLEDSVSIDEKDAARELVRELTAFMRFKNTETIVRINPYDTDYYLLDVEVIRKCPIDMILLPKACIDSVKDLDSQLEGTNIKIMVLIETAEGIENIIDILKASKRCCGLMLGGEDLCVDLNCQRTKEGHELLYARTRLVNACKALKKMVIDTPFTDTDDVRGLKKDIILAKGLGFDGKAAINPRQIDLINQLFSPSLDEIAHAKRVIHAKNKALKEGKGVFSLAGKMVDLPIIKRATHILESARKMGLIEGDDGNEWV